MQDAEKARCGAHVWGHRTVSRPHLHTHPHHGTLVFGQTDEIFALGCGCVWERPLKIKLNLRLEALSLTERPHQIPLAAFKPGGKGKDGAQGEGLLTCGPGWVRHSRAPERSPTSTQLSEGKTIGRPRAVKCLSTQSRQVGLQNSPWAF